MAMGIVVLRVYVPEVYVIIALLKGEHVLMTATPAQRIFVLMEYVPTSLLLKGKHVLMIAMNVQRIYVLVVYAHIFRGVVCRVVK